MAVNPYTVGLPQFLAGDLNPDQLLEEINAEPLIIDTCLSVVNINGNNVDIYFDNPIDLAEQGEVDSIVSAHIGSIASSFETISNGTANTTMNLSSVQTVDRTLTLPDATDTIVARDTTDTLNNKTIISTASIIPGTNTISIGGGDITSGTIDVNRIPTTSIDHDNLLNYVSNEHIDHSSVSINSGIGIAGGGNITASRTLDLDFNSLGTHTSFDPSADFIATFDADGGASSHKKILPNNLLNSTLPTTTKGDLIVHNGTTNVRLPVGSDGQIIKALASDPEGIVWTTSQDLFDVVVDASGNGDYATLGAAVSAGETSIFIKDGAYVESADISILNGSLIVGESLDVAISMGANELKVDGSGGAKETAGTVSITNGTTAVVGTSTTFTNITDTNAYINLGGIYYEVSSITDNTNIVLVDTFEGNDIAGGRYVLQQMASVELRNFTVDATSTGFLVQSVINSKISNIKTENCVNGFNIFDCGECDFIDLNATNNSGVGINTDGNIACNFYNNKCTNNGGNGFYVSNSNQVQVDKLISSNNRDSGIYLFLVQLGNEASVTNSIFINNENYGLYTIPPQGFLKVHNCIASKNNAGIWCSAQTTISSCTVFENVSDGIFCSTTCEVVNNKIEDNGGVGIYVVNRTIISNNYIRGNNGGIYIQSNDSIISNNRIYDNTGIGVDIDGTRNSVNSNFFYNNTDGIFLNGFENNICGNIIYDHDTGINITNISIRNIINGNRISTCIASSISVNGRGNQILNNNVQFAATAGILISSGGDDCVINGNYCTNMEIGISIGADYCVIVGNRIRFTNGVGLTILAGATDNTVLSNNFQNNNGTDFLDAGTITALEPILINRINPRSGTALTIGGEIEILNTAVAPGTANTLYNLTGDNALYWDGAGGAPIDLTAGGSTASIIESETITTSTNSSVYVVINGMEAVAPPAGTYLVMFSASGEIDTNNQTGSYEIYNNGVAVAHTERNFETTGTPTTNQGRTMHTQSIETVTGTENIDVRYLTSGGVFTIFERSLILIKLS